MNHTPHAQRCNLTPLYCLHQASYYFAIAGVGAFAVAYLMDKGFAASQAGIMLATTSICSCVLQPLLGSFVDRRSMALLPKILLGFLAAAFAAFISIEIFRPPVSVIAVLFPIGSLTFSITCSLSNSLCAYYAQSGCRINYAMGSGIGSLCFSFASLIIGYILTGWGSTAMMAFCLSFIVAQMLLTLRYPRIEGQAIRRGAPASSLSLAAFCLRYRRFIATLLSVMLLAACHSMAENFLLQIFERVGGTSENVGTALFVACITATPFLLMFEKIQRKTGPVILMRLSGLFYVAKAVLLLFAPSVTSIYLISLLQSFTFGFLSPSLFYFVGLRVSKADTAKGQMMATSLYTLGTALGNSLGGAAIDRFSVNAMLILAASLAAAGTLLLNLTISRVDVTE